MDSNPKCQAVFPKGSSFVSIFLLHESSNWIFPLKSVEQIKLQRMELILYFITHTNIFAVNLLQYP